MKLVSFNTNGIRARLHQLAALIESHQPDVIGIQETKVSDDEFPVAAIEAMGYHVVYHGQKGHYGVCLISRQPPAWVHKGFAEDDADAQKRLIIGRFSSQNGTPVTVINGYFPQGENLAHPTKFPAKQKYYADLLAHLQQHCDPSEALVVMGDLNISPEDIDIGIGENNRKRWLRDGKTSFQPIEREWLQSLKDWGLQDTYRLISPEDNEHFSWFDYRSRGFEREPRRGLRIDAILTTAPLAQVCTDAGIDYAIRGMDKPSDHAPVWATFDI